MDNQNRRSFLASLGALAVGAPSLLRAEREAWPGMARLSLAKKLDRIGIQLYTVRKQAMTDLPATLAQLAQYGFNEIEFWGTFPQKPPEIRQILDKNGLTSPSGHYGFPRTPDGFAKIFDDAKTMGQEWATFPSVPNGPTATVDDWKRIAMQFNDAGDRARSAGLKFAFHNHNVEFRKIGDTVPFEVLVKETDPKIVWFELDLHWAISGGADPVDLFHRYPGRFTMVHIKDSAGPPDFKQTDVGAGSYDWKKLLAESNAAGIQHYFVEHDSPADPMAFAKSAHDYLAKLEF